MIRRMSESSGAWIRELTEWSRVDACGWSGSLLERMTSPPTMFHVERELAVAPNGRAFDWLR